VWGSNRLEQAAARPVGCKTPCACSRHARQALDTPQRVLATPLLRCSPLLLAGLPLQTEADLTLVTEHLPEYGDSFKQLSVSITPETPYRLHVKIAPLGVARWEVPETVVARCVCVCVVCVCFRLLHAVAGGDGGRVPNLCATAGDRQCHNTTNAHCRLPSAGCLLTHTHTHTRTGQDSKQG
jgi:hypothetical protein